MTNFGKAQIKGEGTEINYDKGMKPSKQFVETTYIEFSLPVHLEDECWAMIQQWLKERGANI